LFIGSSGAPPNALILFPSIGIFPVIVVTFVCFIIELKVPSGFSISSSFGFSKFSTTLLFSIVLPGTKINVLSSFFLMFQCFGFYFALLKSYFFLLN
jgi:hypothetical protein